MALHFTFALLFYWPAFYQQRGIYRFFKRQHNLPRNVALPRRGRVYRLRLPADYRWGVLKHARHVLRKKSAGLLVAREAKNARVNSPRCPNFRLWRGRPGLASRWHLAGGREQGQDALATDNSSGVVALTLGTSLCKRPAEVVGFLEAFGLVADGSFFAYARDDDLAEKLYLKIGKRLLEELARQAGGPSAGNL